MISASSLLRFGSLALLALIAHQLTAQSQVPTYVNYQAYVTDDVGVPLGAGAPVSRKIWIKLYTAPTGTDLIHAEEQTALFFEGMLNTLIGQGAQVGSETFLTDLGEAFQHEELYIGLSVAESDGADPVSEITPRQRIVTTPYAFRTRVAETILDNAVGASQIAADAVTASQIQADAVDAAEIKADAVGASEIAPNAVQESELADNSVDSAAIINGEVGTNDLANGAVTAAKLAAGSINNTHVAANILTAGNLAEDSVGTSELANNAVYSANIQDGQVTAADIATGAVGTDETGGALFTFVTFKFARALGKIKTGNTGLSTSQWTFWGFRETPTGGLVNAGVSGGTWIISSAGGTGIGTSDGTGYAMFVRNTFQATITVN